MKKILLSLAAVGAVVAAAAPAAAQPWRDYGPGPGAARYDGYHQPYHDRRLSTGYVDSLDWKIRNAAREGRISWDEARALRGEVRAVQPIAWRVQTGQASRWETHRLERTVDHVEYAVSRGEYGWRR
jgi:hypothetical protein